jgi:hypothetical protein
MVDRRWEITAGDGRWQMADGRWKVITIGDGRWKIVTIGDGRGKIGDG